MCSQYLGALLFRCQVAQAPQCCSFRAGSIGWTKGVTGANEVWHLQDDMQKRRQLAVVVSVENLWSPLLAVASLIFVHMWCAAHADASLNVVWGVFEDGHSYNMSQTVTDCMHNPAIPCCAGAHAEWMDTTQQDPVEQVHGWKQHR